MAPTHYPPLLSQVEALANMYTLVFTVLKGNLAPNKAQRQGNHFFNVYAYTTGSVHMLY